MDRDEFNRRISEIDTSFTKCKRRIDASDSHWVLLPSTLQKAAGDLSAGEAVSGDELLRLHKYFRDDIPLIDHNGNPFVLYIPDFATGMFGEPNRRYHLTWCWKLAEMEKGGRGQKYVAKYDLQNNEFMGDVGHGRKVHKKLFACLYCKKKLESKFSAGKLYFDRENMDIVKFFKLHGRQDLIDKNNPMFSVGYPENWREISSAIKKERGNKCEEEGCGSITRLEAHHINGITDAANSIPSNLKVLCRSCHKKQFGHGHMRE